MSGAFRIIMKCARGFFGDARRQVRQNQRRKLNLDDYKRRLAELSQ